MVRISKNVNWTADIEVLLLPAYVNVIHISTKRMYKKGFEYLSKKKKKKGFE